MARARTEKLPPVFALVARPLLAFFRLEAASSLLLLAATVVAMVWANSPWAPQYRALLELPFSLGAGASQAGFDLHALVNDGLMTIFFFVVGMEIKRELVQGELQTWQQAVLPLAAACGGMLLPAGLFLVFNHGRDTSVGWAIPMATDIAFSIGLLTVLRGRVSNALVVFLTALAIFDDMGGILVIALFYGSGIHLSWLAFVGVLLGVLVLANRLYVRSGLFYGVMGLALWYGLHHAGVHATLSGVALGLAIPSLPSREVRGVLTELTAHVEALLGKGKDRVDPHELLVIEERLEDLEPPLQRFVHFLHPWMAFVIVPLFAWANAGVALGDVTMASLLEPLPLGIMVGLVVGKSLGIWAFSVGAMRLGVGRLPSGSRPAQLFGVGMVGGIGFTVALFVAQLAFADAPAHLDEAKLGIVVGSLLAALLGYGFLRVLPPPRGAAAPG